MPRKLYTQYKTSTFLLFSMGSRTWWYILGYFIFPLFFFWMKSVISPISLCLYTHLPFFMQFFGFLCGTIPFGNENILKFICMHMHACILYTCEIFNTDSFLIFNVSVVMILYFSVHNVSFFFFVLTFIVIIRDEHCKMFQLCSCMWH